MLNLIMEQWLLGGKILSKVVNNIDSGEHSEPARKYCCLRVMNRLKMWVGAEDFQS